MSRMFPWVGWALGALTWAVAGFACDTPTRPRAKAPLVQRAFPETGDFRPDSSPVLDQPGRSVAATPVAARAAAAGPSVAEPAPASSNTERVAAVLLMLPVGADEQAGTRGTRTYKVSLGANLGEANVEIDGRDVGAMPVRRVYPQPPDVGAGLTRSALLAPRPAPFAGGMRADAAGRSATYPTSGDVPRARSPRHPATAVNWSLPTAQAPSSNPNGAPIID